MKGRKVMDEWDKTRGWWLWILTGVLWASASFGWTVAQTQQATPMVASVVIQVTDATGAALPGAEVRLAAVPGTAAQNAPENMAADTKGEVSLHVTPARYVAIVSMAGFNRAGECLEVRPRAETQTFSVVLQVARSSGLPVTSIENDTLLISLSPSHAEIWLKPADLKAMPRKTVVIHNGHTDADEKYEGVLLADLLTKYGAPVGKDLHGIALAYYIVATGADRYKAVFSLAELDPSFHPGDVLVADTLDGKELEARSGPFKLVVTEDKRPARGVRNLVSLRLLGAE
jgi:hypothetical protein